MRVISILLLIISMPSQAWEYRAVDLTSNNFKSVLTYSSEHVVSEARNYTIIQVEGLPAPCDKGVWYSATDNPDIHSMVMAAYVSKQNAYLGYDIDRTKTPWNASNSCPLAAFRLQ